MNLPLYYVLTYNGRHIISAVWSTDSQSLLLGNYSWPDTRDYFYKALTATDDTIRSTSYANCFKEIGQVMHLVEDLSVPAHTRNDEHIFSCI